MEKGAGWAVREDLFERCQRADFSPLSGLPFVRLDLRYASPENICGRDLYAGEREAWLHQEAFSALTACGQTLARRRPGWKLRVYDAARPLAVQRLLFARVAGTPRQAYVADPVQGSVHNYGFALDLGLEDALGQERDLGSPFDSFELVSQPQLEEALVKQGALGVGEMELRLLLREVMGSGGFSQHPLEWWHYELRPLDSLRGRYDFIGL